MENKILKICTDIRAITDEEIAQVRQIYEDQLSYNNPLKPATSGWQYELGLYNKNVLEALLNLKKLIEAGTDIQQP